MLLAKELLFDVEMIDNPLNAVSAQSKLIMGFIGMPEGFQGCTQRKVLNSCSPVFNLLPNSQVFPVVEMMLINAGCTFDKGYKMNAEKTVFEAHYIIKEVDGVDVGVVIGQIKFDDEGNEISDKIYPTAIVKNSYNGFEQGSLIFGYFRMICGNGLVIPLEGKEESNFIIKGKHTKKLSFSFEQFKEKIDFFLGEQDKMKKKFDVLGDRAVPTYEERVLEVLVATNIATTDNQFKAIAEVIGREAKTLDCEVNDFLIYNGINAHIYKGVDSKGNRSKALPEAKRKLDKKVFSYMVAN